MPVGDRVDMMLEALGGRQVWAAARSVHTMERARYPVYGDGVVASHWLDLELPAEKVAISGERVDIEWAWQASGGWVRRGDEVRNFEGKDIEDRRAVWNVDLVRLLMRLARKDAAFELKPLDPLGILVLDKGEPVAEFYLTRDGELFKWRRLQGKEVTMIFGSLRNFGKVRFPDWGTSTTGEWSAYFTLVQLSNQPLAQNVSFKKPGATGSEWHGGALHPDRCEPE